MESVKVSIVRIGNSQGILIPDTLLEQCHLQGEVELEPGENYLIIRSAAKSRAGWDKAFCAMAQQGDDALLDGDMPLETTWEQDEWQW